jgi:hypothetical protein
VDVLVEKLRREERFGDKPADSLRIDTVEDN